MLRRKEEPREPAAAPPGAQHGGNPAPRSIRSGAAHGSTLPPLVLLDRVPTPVPLLLLLLPLPLLLPLFPRYKCGGAESGPLAPGPRGGAPGARGLQGARSPPKGGPDTAAAANKAEAG